ncbi:MAG: hypothetical protein KKH68_03235 [Proteobacteria bacterium]|nr:hypothetical protein [Pseudomonadota bacterium]
MDIGTTLLISMFFGSIGVGYFVYGKKQQQLTMMLSGIALCVYPYFISNAYAMVAIGIVLTAVPWTIGT